MASDPLADMQNLMGYTSHGLGIEGGLTGQNPYLYFQGKYPFGQGADYSPQGQAMPGMAQFNTGVFGNRPPTDAYGNPIQGFVDYSNDQNAAHAKQMADYNAAQPPPGKTINSLPAGISDSGGGSDNSALMNYIASQNAAIEGSPSSLNQGGFGAGNNVFSNSALMQIQNNAQQMDILRRQQQAATSPAAAAGPAPPPTPTNMHDAYLDALSNPGPPMMPGATMQPGTTATGSAAPNVMGAFLASQGGSGTPFTKTLKGLPQGTA